MTNTALPNLAGLITLKIGQSRAYDKGGFSNIWLATLNQGNRTPPLEVAIKVLRCSNDTDPAALDKMRRHLKREVAVWSKLQHPHVAQLYGLCEPKDLSDQLDPQVQALVSPFCAHGNITVYLKGTPEAVRIKVLHQIATGLAYLHRNSIVHGDLKGKNVLIDDGGNARLTDFGLSRIIGESGFTSKSPGSSSRYTSIELLETELPDNVPLRFTKESDVWAFGLTALEVFHPGARPYPRLPGDEQVIIFLLLKRGRPERFDYPDVPDKIWEILKECWESVENRPKIDGVTGIVEKLEKV